MPKNKPHKGLLKRVRITKTGKVRHATAGFKHLRSHKSSKRLRAMRKGSMMDASDVGRISKLLFRRLRGASQPRSAMRRSPSPEERRAAREAARQAVKSES
jgi:large subunit ribosomal protein L35